MLIGKVKSKMDKFLTERKGKNDGNSICILGKNTILGYYNVHFMKINIFESLLKQAVSVLIIFLTILKNLDICL